MFSKHSASLFIIADSYYDLLCTSRDNVWISLFMSPYSSIVALMRSQNYSHCFWFSTLASPSTLTTSSICLENFNFSFIFLLNFHSERSTTRKKSTRNLLDLRTWLLFMLPRNLLYICIRFVASDSLVAVSFFKGSGGTRMYGNLDTRIRLKA